MFRRLDDNAITAFPGGGSVEKARVSARGWRAPCRGSVVTGGPVDLPVPDGRWRRCPEILRCAPFPVLHIAADSIYGMLEAAPLHTASGQCGGCAGGRCVPGRQQAFGWGRACVRWLAAANIRSYRAPAHLW
ncbi:unnamed protein product [Urochloa humidicola]